MRRSPQTRMKRVLLLIESSRGYGRACLQGVADYCRIHGSWQVIHVERSLSEDLPVDLNQWKIDGVISRAETPAVARKIDQLDVPAVDLRGAHPPRSGIVFDTDARACVQLAVDHLMECGLRDLAFCGYSGINYSDQRAAVFAEYARERGCRTYSFSTRHNHHDTMATELLGERDNRELVNWVGTLPHPAGIVACNDVRARQVLVACELAKVSVPEDIAVVGIDNDQTICDLATPPLSSVEPDARRIGREGAAYLDRLMNGEAIAESTILIPPKGIVVRTSSDVVAIADREVAAVLRYIRDHACEGINVEYVVDHVHLSRSSLDRRFKQLVGRSVKAEIDRVRINRAKLLLQETDLKITSIAHQIAYSSAAKFIDVFKRVTGVTPGKYRELWHVNKARRNGDRA